MTLLEVAKWLKEEIIEDFSNQNLDSIVQQLNSMNLTKQQIDFLYEYCRSDGYDEETKVFFDCESDNSEFLKYVNYVFARLGNGKSK